MKVITGPNITKDFVTPNKKVKCSTSVLVSLFEDVKTDFKNLINISQNKNKMFNAIFVTKKLTKNKITVNLCHFCTQIFVSIFYDNFYFYSVIKVY